MPPAFAIGRRRGYASGRMDGTAQTTARRGAAERLLLLLVILIVGGALGYAAYRVSVGGGPPDLPPGDVAVVSKGEEVDLVAHAVRGKYTVYDFYADWCPPCRVLDVQLRGLASRHPNLAVRKIDIVDWTTPVVAQHGIHGLPHMILYGPEGERLAAGDEVYPLLSELFAAELY